MKWPAFVRNHLAVKLFLSYLLVLVIGMAVLWVGTRVALPRAFQRHLGPMAGVTGRGESQRQQLYADFQAGVSDAMLWAGAAAFVSASIISLLVSRQVVSPVQQMMVASRRIADGHYGERVEVSDGVASASVDELGQLALSFNRMADKLASTEAMRRELIGDVAHELRTPLATVKGYMEGLIDGALPPAPETYQRVYAEADRLQRLVQSLQELSRIEAGAFDLRPEPLSVGDAVEESLAHLARQYEEKGVSMTSRTAADLPKALADRDRVQQVLLNLLGNALQYTPEGGSVTVSIRRQGEEVAIAVTDSGIGLAPESLPHVFDRFYRVDRSRARASGGSGIGLTVAKHLVESQGGHMWAESSGLGRGSTFTFTLPLAR
jgi:signal transduction histidine kinase